MWYSRLRHRPKRCKQFKSTTHATIRVLHMLYTINITSFTKQSRHVMACHGMSCHVMPSCSNSVSSGKEQSYVGIFLGPLSPQAMHVVAAPAGKARVQACSSHVFKNHVNGLRFTVNVNDCYQYTREGKRRRGRSNTIHHAIDFTTGKVDTTHTYRAPLGLQTHTHTHLSDGQT